MRFPESWSSTSLANDAVLGTAQDISVLDNAFALIEGQPALDNVFTLIEGQPSCVSQKLRAKRAKSSELRMFLFCCRMQAFPRGSFQPHVVSVPKTSLLMAEPPKDQQSQEPDISQLLSQANQLLEEIRSFREQAEVQLKQAEVSSKKADSEALLAFNAKNACEGHATTIAGVKGTVEADANTIATNKQRSDEVVAAINSAKANLDVDMKAIEGRRKEADQSAIIVEQYLASITNAAEGGVSRLKDIEAFQTTAEGHAKTAAGAATIADQAASGADSAHERTAKSAADAEALVSAISGHRDSTTQVVSETKTLLVDAQASEASLKQVLEHLANSDQISITHEKRVETLSGELQSLIQRVEGLLPGATSAGLASSFRQQRSRFTAPQKQWLWMFVTCIGLLVILALPSFLSAIGVGHSTDQSWSTAWRNVTLRLPIIAPLSILDLRERAGQCFDRFFPCFGNRFGKDERVELRWYLLRKDVVPGSKRKAFAKQVSLLAKREAVPRACEAVYGVTLYFLARGIRLFAHAAARCADIEPAFIVPTPVHVDVGNFKESGLLVSLWDDRPDVDIGLASMVVPTRATN